MEILSTFYFKQKSELFSHKDIFSFRHFLNFWWNMHLLQGNKENFILPRKKRNTKNKPFDHLCLLKYRSITFCASSDWYLASLVQWNSFYTDIVQWETNNEPFRGLINVIETTDNKRKGKSLSFDWAVGKHIFQFPP